MNIILPIKDIFIIAGNIVFSVLYNEHLEFPCRCQLLSSNSEVMQELYIEKELFIKRTTENDCRALVLRGTLEYLFDEIIAGECALALLQKEIKKDLMFMLNQYGINYLTLFPDLEGLSKHLGWFAENYNYWDNSFEN